MLFVDVIDEKIIHAKGAVNAVSLLRNKQRYVLVIGKRGSILFCTNGKNYKILNNNKIKEI
ncbi:MAG: hypothetical protein QW255_04670 [Candidatus Bilamarchaeaceae archaeon]